MRDLQLFSRPSNEDDGAVDVRRVLDSSANIVMNEIRARARLTKHYGDVPLIAANPARLGQVFLNLVLNAAQAIREGDPAKNEIRLETRVEEGAIVVRVSDTGEGIPREIRERIFDPFFTTKPMGAGTGLGLSISRGIVTAMGGELVVEDRARARTTFRVRLPIVGGEAARPPPRPPGPPRPRRARLLVIDDEPLIGATLTRVLGDAYDIEAMTNPDAAIARLTGGARFDLILCDLMMPGRNGMDVHAAVARSSPEQAQRMVFLTGGAFSAAAKEFLSRAEAPIVDKPFSVDELRGQNRCHAREVRVRLMIGAPRSLARRSEVRMNLGDAETPRIDGGPLVLIVDDDQDSRETARRVLEEEGYTVDVAPNGRVALERLQRQSPGRRSCSSI